MENKHSIQNVSYVYGNVKISAASKFIVKHPYRVYIGITSAKQIVIEQRFTMDKNNDYYAFSNGGVKYDLSHMEMDGFDKDYDHDLSGFSVGDYVIMELNPIEKILKYHMMEKDESFIVSKTVIQFYYILQ